MRTVCFRLPVVLIAVWISAATTAFGSEYMVRAWAMGNMIGEAKGPTASQGLDDVWEVSGNRLTYKGVVLKGQFKAYLDFNKPGDWQQYALSLVEDQTWSDVVFSCPDGVASVDAIANLRIKGSVSFSPTQGPEFTFGLWFGGGNNQPRTHWEVGTAHHGPSRPPFDTVVGNDIDGVYQIELRTAVPTGEPVSISLGYKGAGTIWLQVDTQRDNLGRLVADFWTGDRGISFPDDGSPAFDLPDGCTCNSDDADIVNNVWRGSVPVDHRSWGTIKALYQSD